MFQAYKPPIDSRFFYLIFLNIATVCMHLYHFFQPFMKRSFFLVIGTISAVVHCTAH